MLNLGKVPKIPIQSVAVWTVGYERQSLKLSTFKIGRWFTQCHT